MHFNFEWDPAKARDNHQKHGVTFEEATGLFTDPLTLTLVDNDNSTADETRWITLGRTPTGQFLVVVHTFGEDGDIITVRVISARSATRQERRAYEER